MSERRRSEPAWPLAVIVGVVVLGLGVGVLLPEVLGPDDPAPAPASDGAELREDRLPAPGDRIRVEVLNAGGIQGMAGAVRDRLRDEGFDVVYFGNAPSFGRDTSVVLSRVGGGRAAREVAEALGISEVRIEPDPALLVDVTVLLGSDWSRVGALDGREGGLSGDGTRSGNPVRAWWDPRRLFDAMR